MIKNIYLLTVLGIACVCSISAEDVKERGRPESNHAREETERSRDRDRENGNRLSRLDSKEREPRGRPGVQRNEPIQKRLARDEERPERSGGEEIRLAANDDREADESKFSHCGCCKK